MGFSTTELAWMRDAVETYLLTDTCTIQTRAWQSDDMGGGTWVWSDAYTSVPCRIVPHGLASREAVVGGELKIHDFWAVVMPYDQTIDETMRIKFGSDTFEVNQVGDAESDLTARRVECTRVGA